MVKAQTLEHTSKLAAPGPLGRAERPGISSVTASARSMQCIQPRSSVLLNLSFSGELFYSAAFPSVPRRRGSLAASRIENVLILLHKPRARGGKCSPADTFQSLPSDVAHMP